MLDPVMFCGPLENERVEALDAFEIAGTAREPRFDSIVEIAAEVFGTAMSFVTLIDRDTQWLKARVGLDIPSTPRSISFCTHTILSAEVMIVADAASDPRFADNPLVTGAPGIRFYAGAPLMDANGLRVGALCVIDTKPRADFSEKDCRILQRMAALVVGQMELRRLQRQQATIAGLARNAELALISVDRQENINFANDAAARLFGYEQQEFVGQPLDIIIPERMRGAHRAGMTRVMESGVSKLAGKTVELFARHRNGHDFPIEFSLCKWESERGIELGAMMRDISERRERDTRLLRLANHDTLTGLCNRQRFEAILGEGLSRGDHAAVLLFDLDRFKDVNDSLGHAVGDTLLQAIAVRLPAVLEANAMVARFGGDEFAVLLPGVADAAMAGACAKAILSAFEAPFEIGGNIFHLGASIGYAVGPKHGVDPEELIASADFALYEAKQTGGRCAILFEPCMRNSSAEMRAIQDELLQALQRKELVLHYQPQVSLETGRIFGFEALLRWQHPTKGLLPPNAFLPALENSSLSLRVGWWVLEEACRQLAEWHSQGFDDIRVSVNLFAAQVRSGSILGQVAQALEVNRLDPSHLELEVTETIALNQDDFSLAAIRDLRTLGVRIAFDDFGTGYASLSSLQRFPLTTLKIDRSFVRDLLDNPQDAAITRAMILMGNDIGLETIAEGIETVEQEDMLRLLGCSAGQGYLYGKALAPDVALVLLDDDRRPGLAVARA